MVSTQSKTAICVALMLLAVTANASRFVIQGTRAIVGDRQKVPIRWQAVGRAHGHMPVSFMVALRQNNLGALNKLFWEVSDPDSPKYAHYMTIDEINSLVSNPVAAHEVTAWLREYNVPSESITATADAIYVEDVPASTIEAMFQTEMHQFLQIDSVPQRLIVRQMGAFSIPTALTPYVDIIAGLSEFPVPHLGVRMSHNSGVLSVNSADGDIIPRTLRELYNIPDDETAAGTTSSQGVIEYQGASAYADSDMQQFYSETDTPVANISNKVGKFDPTPATESVLDIQYLTAVGVGANNWYWTAPGWLLEFSNKFFNTQQVPSVISQSYGWSEQQQCEIAQDKCSQLGLDSNAYVARVNVEFQKIALRGVSILASSGDSGANGRTDPFCTDSQLHPVFPAASPYLTSVGATQIDNPAQASYPDPVCNQVTCAKAGTEVAVSKAVAGFASGGGFSNVAATPDYQKDAVSSYLSSGVELPPSSYFNSTGRGFPDVAANGHNTLIYINGANEAVGGTSASCPIFAGTVALLNAARLRAGKQPLGFLNPVLYKMAKEAPNTFNDIVKGDNKCTENTCTGCKGFVSTQGWDPVTGLGTPNYQAMKKYVLNLP